MDNQKEKQEFERLAVNTIRMLAVDAVQKAQSGHPGMPMGMADCAFVLWSRYLKFNPHDPMWPNRDRFVLSAGHGSMLLYAVLHLVGYDITIEDLKAFRQFNSKTPGHPEYKKTPGVETTTGPLGQGFANGVGMALASKIMAEKFNRQDFAPIDHRIYAIVSDGDMMEGITHEAASLAGHLKLGNLIYLYDDNRITIEGETRLAFSEDVMQRFNAYGWHTVRIDGHNHKEIADAIQQSIEEKNKPSLIIARTHIGFGSPNKQDDACSHGAPLGEEEVIKTKQNLVWPQEPTFYVPDEVRSFFKSQVGRLKVEYDKWQQDFRSWQKNYPDLKSLWVKMQNKEIPRELEKQLISALTEKSSATRSIGGKILNQIAATVPGIIGGAADLSPSTNTFLTGFPSIEPGHFEGRNLHFGVREHGMGGILNGMALYGGLIPFGSTFFIFSDYMRPSIRLATIMGLQVIYVFTHDSIFVGEDGPTHQPVEQLASLRAVPGLVLFRPADGLETAMAWSYAVRRKDGPTALCLTRQSVPNLVRDKNFDQKHIHKGGYILSSEERGEPDVILVASGSEVSTACEGKIILEKAGKKVRVVSMPSLEVFAKQPESYKQSVLAQDTIPVVVVEAGIAQGWSGLSRAPLLFIGLNGYGASAPYQILAEQFGFTGKSVAERVLSWLNELPQPSKS